MSNTCKINAKNVVTITVLAVLLIITLDINARIGHRTNFRNLLTNDEDTTHKKNKRDSNKKVPPPQDTSHKTNKVDTNSITIDTVHISKDSLDAPVKYAAEDSGVLMIETRDFYLYGTAKTIYKDLNVAAKVIRYNQASQTISAAGSSDTGANALNKASFTQGDMKTLSDSMKYNMHSLKGITYNTYYNEGEMYVNAKRLKKVSNDVFYAYGAAFTTCNLDTPHFVFRTKKMKLINNKIGVSGPTHPEFEGVPIPIYIPFGIYPLNRSRHSGILVPTFTTSENFGLGLEQLGYYKVLSDYSDVTLKTNIYSYGGWTGEVSSKYIKRYHYTGSFDITLQHTKSLNTGYYATTENEFTTGSTFMVHWSHTRDNRARPGTTFGANVNFGSTRYNSYVLNNPSINFNNQVSSSISYTKNWNNKFNLSVNANHDQNSVTHLVNLNLPTATLTANTFYPFQKKEQVGNGKWYEKVSIGYSGNIQNKISFYDTAGVTVKKLLDTLQWGADHTIPISLPLPALGAFTITPSISFEERWYGQKLIRSWDNVHDTVLTSVQKGFFSANQMSFGVGIATRIFGTYQFKKGSLIAIRHEMRPNISLSYKPDLMSKYFYSTQVDTFGGGHSLRFSQFDGGLLGSFSEGNFGGINFGIDNFLEAKVKNKQDSTGENATKKIKLIDGFGFNSSYNLMADSFALSNFSFYLRSTLFEKVNITASTILDPYEVDKYGFRKNRLMLKDGSLGRITGGNLAISTSFKSKSTDGKTDKDRIAADPYLTPDEQQRQLEYIRQNPAEFTDFNIPWTLNLSYSLNFSRLLRTDYSGYYTSIFSSVNFSGDFSLTPKWKAGATGYYNLNTLKLEQLSMFITREMHCWQLAINVNPIGLYRSFSITINPKSSILRDLKVNRSRTFSSY